MGGYIVYRIRFCFSVFKLSIYESVKSVHIKPVTSYHNIYLIVSTIATIKNKHSRISIGSSWISDPLSLVSFYFQGIEFLRNKWCVSNICDLLYTEAALINIINGTFPVYKIICSLFISFILSIQYARFVCGFYNIVTCLLPEASNFLIFFLNLFIELNLMFVLIKCYIWQRCMLCKSSLFFPFK